MPLETRERIDKESTDDILERGMAELYYEGMKGWEKQSKFSYNEI